MDYRRLPEYLARARQLLFTEGYVNDGFVYLETVEKECNEEYLVENCVYIFCDQAEGVIRGLEEQLEHTAVDYGMLEETVIRLRSYIISVGAGHMLTKVNHLRQLVEDRSDIPSCKNALQELKRESERFEMELSHYFLLLWQCAFLKYDVDMLILSGVLDPITLAALILWLVTPYEDDIDQRLKRISLVC